MPMIVDSHRSTAAVARTVLARVTPADLDRPTPCADWDLRALLEHMAGQDHGFAAAVTLAPADTDRAAFLPQPIGSDPAESLTASLDGVVAAFAGADRVEGTVLLPEFDNRVPAPVLVSMHLVDILVHGWDVAATLGIADGYRGDLDDDLVSTGLAIAEQVPTDDGYRAPGAPFGPALTAPADADPWTRTLTLLGRDPEWRPTR